MGTEITPSLNYITLQVGDISLVRDWYVDVVGLHMEHEAEEQIAILGGEDGCRLGLESGPPVSEPGNIDFLFQVANVDTTFKGLSSRGVEFWRGPTDEAMANATRSCLIQRDTRLNCFTIPRLNSAN